MPREIEELAALGKALFLLAFGIALLVVVSNMVH